MSHRFSERFGLAPFREGGVILDTLHGAFYRLNTSAAQICALLLADRSVEQTAAVMADQTGIPLAQALQDVNALLRQLETPASAGDRNPIRFCDEGDALLLKWGQEPMCRIDLSNRCVCRLSDACLEFADPALPLLWAAPHILLASNQYVLHAGAVVGRRGVIAFSGPSGVGKTTLAQRMASQNLQLVSEDLLTIVFDQQTPSVITGGEATIRRWVGASRHQWIAGKDVTFDDLTVATEAANCVLTELWMICRSGVRSPRLSHRPLADVDAMLFLLENSFAEQGRREIWKMILCNSQRLVTGCRMKELHVPEGLDLLDEAVQDYATTMNS